MADGKEKEDTQETTLRSGRQYKTDITKQRRASVSGASGSAAASKTKAKTMLSEEALAKALGKINDSLEELKKQGAESKVQVAETNKKIEEISGKIDLNTKSITDLGNKVNSNAEAIGRLLEDSSTT